MSTPANSPLSGWTFPLTRARLIILLLAVVGIGTLIWRFTAGLGASTNLRDDFPWGLWIGFDMMTGVALAAGGFTMAFWIEILGKERYHEFVRPAVLTAFIGYLLAIIGLMGDLGLPWRIYHPIYMWNLHSFMFEVAWCVILYTTVLFVEFLPIPLERFGLKKPLALVKKTMPFFIVAGIILSTLHQSSLGSLFLMMGHKLHALWWSPIIPVHFLLTAIAVGFAMVAFESVLGGWLLRHPINGKLLGDLMKPLPFVLLAALAVRLADLFMRGVLPGALEEGSLQSWSFIVEMSLGLLLPALMLLLPKIRETPAYLFTAVTLVVLGVILNRVNVSMIGMFTPDNYYVPSLAEWVVSVGLVASGVLAVVFITENMPVRQDHHEPARQQPSAA
jgi:Ni/Fe-hydrogenase subunit HybB-like protein